MGVVASIGVEGLVVVAKRNGERQACFIFRLAVVACSHGYLIKTLFYFRHLCLLTLSNYAK